MWEPGKRYRVRGVPGEIALKKNPKNGTPYVEALVEVTLGPELGERLRWRGYFNTDENAESSIAELQTMGVKGRLGDWTGFGSREFQVTAMADEGVGENVGRRYWRASFVRELPRIKEENVMTSTEVEALAKRYEHHLPRPRMNGAPSSTPQHPPGFYDEDENDRNLEFPPST